MAGVKGRSGRKPIPIAVHRLAGTFRADRHGVKAVSSDAKARRRDLERRYGFARKVSDRLMTIINDKDRDASLKLPTLLREFRHQTTLMLQLSAQLERYDRQAPATPQPDDFDEFEGPAQVALTNEESQT
jgi:hypothetical protein